MQSTNELSMAPEAVQEASLSSGTASAETNSGGGTAKFVTKSGTNELHGNLYYFWRNDYLDASGFTNPKAPKRRWNEFGFSVGGPVIKDRLFSFLNVNWFRRSDEGGSDFLSVPTAAVKSGDLSSLLGDEVAPGIRANQLFDPATTRDDGLGGFTRDPFRETSSHRTGSVKYRRTSTAFSPLRQAQATSIIICLQARRRLRTSNGPREQISGLLIGRISTL